MQHKKLRLSKDLKMNITAWLLLLPSLLFLAGFTVWPIFRSLYLSFTNFELGMKAPEFIGVDNYVKLAGDGLFWKVIGNSFAFALMTVLPSMFLGLMAAMILNKSFRGIGFLRTAFFYPVVMPMIAIANIWNFIYMPQSGMLDQILSFFNLGGQQLLSSEKTVLPALALMYIWKETGYLMIFYLSGLQNISSEIYEAAKIDGASPLVVFRKITLPLLMPTTLFVSTIALTNSFKLVDHIVVMTEGAPSNASTLLLYYIYQNAFTFFDQGIAATLTVIMLVVMLGFAMFQFFGTDSKIHYN